jgi:predicted ATPase
LDNCEHLIEACANLAGSLMQGCSKLVILATSRESLDVAGEATFYVPSLSVPKLTDLHILEQVQFSEAARLFVDRAKAASPIFQITEQNALALARICSRLDGIPLAIELAAARINLLTPEQLADRLEHSFTLLAGGPRTSLPRHQTLRAAIDWSYNLLSKAERILLHRLSIFSGGWSIEAAERVCASDEIQSDQVLELLGSLVSKSMVLADHVEDGEMRYRLLETIRQFAREKLIDSDEELAIRTRHRDYFLWLAEQAEPRLRSGERLVWTRKIELETYNLFQAMEWSLIQPDGLVPTLRILAALVRRLWYPRGYIPQIDTYLIKGLAMARDDPSVPRLLLAKIISLNLYSKASIDMANLVIEGILMCQELGPDADIERCRILSLASFASSALKGDFSTASFLGEECLKLVRLLDSSNAWDKALALTHISWGYILFMDQYEVLQGYAEEALRCFQQSGDLWDGGPYIVLGHISKIKGEFDKAYAYYEKAVTVYDESGDQIGKLWSYFYLGDLELTRGNYSDVKKLIKELLNLSYEIFEIEGLANSIMLLGVYKVLYDDPLTLTSRNRNYIKACRYFGAVEVLFENALTRKSTELKNYYKAALETLHSELPINVLTTAWKEGSEMSLNEAVKFALLDED